jgi:hypothetical protein
VLKAFEPEQHELYDPAAKTLGIKFWNKLGYSCTENPDEFGIDLIVEGQGRKFFCEVEIPLVVSASTRISVLRPLAGFDIRQSHTNYPLCKLISQASVHGFCL